MSSGISSAIALMGARSASPKTFTVSRPRNFREAFAGASFTHTSPSPIISCTRARLTDSRRAATNESSRLPASSAATEIRMGNACVTRRRIADATRPKDVSSLRYTLPMLKRMLPNAWWSRCLWIVATYILAADVLPNLLLVLVNSAGYLPYSDRPGPGWQMPHLPTGAELRFFVGFASLPLEGTVFYGLIFAAEGWILGFCSLPRWVLRVLASPTAFLASGLMMAAAGWMIAISSFGVYMAAGCGALWGLFVFPRLVPRMSYILPIAPRIALPVVIFIGGVLWLVKTLLPDPGLTNGKIEVIRRDDVGVDFSTVDLSYVGPSIAREAKGSGRYVLGNRMEFTTRSRNQVRVLLVIDDDQPIAHTFLLPRSGDAIYRQSLGKWNEEQAKARSSKISLELSSQNS